MAKQQQHHDEASYGSVDMDQTRIPSPLEEEQEQQKQHNDRNNNNEKNLSSNTSALVNIIKANIGSGILGMPYAFRCAGYWLGTFSIVIIMLIVVHCTILLVESKRHLNKIIKKKRKNGDNSEKELTTFNDLGYAAFGRVATVIITFFLFVTQLGFCCAYLTFVSSNLMNIFGTPTTLGWKALFIFLTGMTVFPFSCIRNLKYLSPVSILSEILITLGVGIVLYFAIFKLATEPFPGSYRNLQPYNIEQFPTFFGICLFAFEGIGLVLPIESNMRNKKAYPMLLFVGLIIICASMTLLGIVGYLSYGMGVNSLITFNLPTTGALPLIIKIFLMISLIFTYPIQLFPLSQMMDNASKRIIKRIKERLNPEDATTLVSHELNQDGNSINDSNENIMEEKETNTFKLLMKALLSPSFHIENGIRFIMVMITVVFSAFIPSFGDFLGLIGGFGGTTLALVLPCCIHTKVMWKSLSWSVKAKNTTLIVFGLFATGFSTYISFRDLVENLENGN